MNPENPTYDKPDDVRAGTPEASTAEWREKYNRPEHIGATCRRCGSNVGNLTVHEEFHQKLNVMYGASGLPLYATTV